LVAKGGSFRVSGASLAMKGSVILVSSEATNGGVVDTTNGKITLSSTYIRKNGFMTGNISVVGPQSTVVLINDDGSPAYTGSNVYCNNVTYSTGLAMVDEIGTNLCAPIFLTCIAQLYDNSNCFAAATLVSDP
jgi:hypothetical protein